MRARGPCPLFLVVPIILCACGHYHVVSIRPFNEQSFEVYGNAHSQEVAETGGNAAAEAFCNEKQLHAVRQYTFKIGRKKFKTRFACE